MKVGQVNAVVPQFYDYSQMKKEDYQEVIEMYENIVHSVFHELNKEQREY